MNQEFAVSDAPRPLIAGNWKMNGLRAALQEIETLRDAVRAGHVGSVDLAICPPATLIHAAVQACGGVLSIGGQDCHGAPCGAHTGDISAEMLADAGAGLVIVGHSERRTDHHESNPTVRAKTEAAWRAGLIAVLCVGELREEREEGRETEVVGGQLAGSVPDGATPDNLVVAYEPVWAIGTGLTPTCEDIAAIHLFIRGELVTRFGEAGQGIRILYGGSVKPGNARELMAVENVDGALVGGASLKATDFLAICACL
ncbi:triose-phosphate isomerase [Terrihabitans rhizophilus]|uniref:Triosephosphate isomerase n=1 Tax=Terrihabitans rhizophilus TaxID=3092662 RepID=A0ABU4RMC7_9HYPH|nr:triose-phosphate isomerase [Terrihabitans sp. PJ23]MDX6805383.1 triose-phosphate isomerase [Terrihabitans sp. PJ23]